VSTFNHEQIHRGLVEKLGRKTMVPEDNPRGRGTKVSVHTLLLTPDSK
jgi:hypothetical protein